MTIMSQNMVQNVKRARSGKPNQTRIERRRSERRMAVERIPISLRPQKMMWATRTMRPLKKGAAKRRKRNNPPRHLAAEQLIQVSSCLNHFTYFKMNMKRRMNFTYFKND